MRIVGIDLAGSEKQVTGFCFMDENLNCETLALHSDKEIIEETLKRDPDIISIDAPLSLPKGRESLEKRGPPHLRACDKELLKMKIKFFPITLGPMRSLTKRGIKFKKFFESKGYKVIESFPGAAQDLLGIPRKQAGTEKLRKALMSFGFKGDIKKEKITSDELDAITCALVGKFYLEKNYVALGDKKEGLIILPKGIRHERLYDKK
ncbi:MAG: DUF429 domain-containing protein [Candidatus Aenigmatarchaeota archaeon]